jgi:hypothetical protein
MIGSCTICKLCASQAGELNKGGMSRALMLGANQTTSINSAFRATHMCDDSDPGHGLPNPSLLQLIFTILKYPSPSLAHVIAGTTGKHAYARQEVQVHVQHRNRLHTHPILSLAQSSPIHTFISIPNLDLHLCQHCTVTVYIFQHRYPIPSSTTTNHHSTPLSTKPSTQ